MKVGDILYTTGVVTLVGSLAGYAALGAASLLAFVTGRDPYIGMMAVAMLAFYAGLVLMACGWALNENTIKEIRNDRHRKTDR